MLKQLLVIIGSRKSIIMISPLISEIVTALADSHVLLRCSHLRSGIGMQEYSCVRTK